MTPFQQFRACVRADLFRYTHTTSFRAFWGCFLFNPGFTCLVWTRLCHAVRQYPPLRQLLLPPLKLIQRHYAYKYGISIPAKTQIGPGFYIGHYGGIVINEYAIIGCNCNISQGVTIGQSNRGKHQGYPVIGDFVFIGPGAMIFGNIRIGNHAAIGANSVVTEDVPDYAVVVGLPAHVVSYQGSDGYIHNTYATGEAAVSPQTA